MDTRERTDGRAATWRGDGRPMRTGRLGPVVYALLGGAVIFVLGTPYFEVAPTNDDPLFNGLLVAAFVTLGAALRRTDAPVTYRTVTRALIIASVAMFTLVVGPFNWIVGVDDDTIQHAFRDKLAQFLAVVPAILVAAWLSGRSMPSLYLVPGHRRRWLTLGTAGFAFCALAVFVVAVADGAATSTILSLAPWLFGFAALNALMEELWFRGVFLRPFETEFGGAIAIGVTAVVFGVSHVGATYISSGEQALFALLVTGLGVLLAWAMRWGGALWGAVLLHIGLDLVVLFGFL